MTATSARWLAFAAIGLLVAVAVAFLATRLVSEKIGISGEPLSAASSLVPRHAGNPRQPHPHQGGAATNTSSVGVITPTTAPAPAPAAPAPSGAGSRPSGERDGGGGGKDD